MKMQGNSFNYSCTLNNKQSNNAAIPVAPVGSLDPATTNLADPIKERTRTEGGKNNWKKHDIEPFGEFPLNSLNEEDEDIILNIQK